VKKDDHGLNQAPIQAMPLAPGRHAQNVACDNAMVARAFHFRFIPRNGASAAATGASRQAMAVG